MSARTPVPFFLALIAVCGIASANSHPVWSTQSLDDSEGRTEGVLTQTESLGDAHIGGVLAFACRPETQDKPAMERVMLHFGVDGEGLRIVGATHASIEVDGEDIGVFTLTPRTNTPALHFIAVDQVEAFVEILAVGHSIVFRTPDDAAVVREVAFSLQGSARAIADAREKCSLLQTK